MDDDSSGDETAYVKLISAEGSEIFLPRRIAVQVEMMKAMLEGGYQVGGPYCFPGLRSLDNTSSGERDRRDKIPGYFNKRARKGSEVPAVSLFDFACLSCKLL